MHPLSFIIVCQFLLMPFFIETLIWTITHPKSFI